MYFVVECVTMSMPCSNGRCRIGVANVPSHTLIALAFRAIAARPARSVIFISGFDGVSTHTRRVDGRTAARTAPKSVIST